MRVVLQIRGADQVQGWRGWLLGMALIIAFLALLPVSFGDLGKFYARLSWPPSQAIVSILLILPLLVVAVFGGIRMLCHSRVTLDDAGIRYRSGLPRTIADFVDWTIPWRKLHTVTSHQSSLGGPLVREVHLAAEGENRRLVPWYWEALEGAGFTPHPADLHKATPEQLAAVWEQTALVRALADRGWPVSATETANAAPRAQNSVQSMALAALFIALMFYAMQDIYFSLDEFYAEGAPMLALIGLGCIGALIAVLIQPASVRTQSDARIIAILFGFSVAFASYPALLRVNTWTDTGGLRPYEYEFKGDGRWEPVEESGPPLEFDIGTGYWTQFQVGHRKTFHLRRGGLGYYQIDMTPIYAEQREYYSGK